jgi:hypothetical protein
MVDQSEDGPTARQYRMPKFLVREPFQNPENVGALALKTVEQFLCFGFHQGQSSHRLTPSGSARTCIPDRTSRAIPGPVGITSSPGPLSGSNLPPRGRPGQRRMSHAAAADGRSIPARLRRRLESPMTRSSGSAIVRRSGCPFGLLPRPRFRAGASRPHLTPRMSTIVRVP